ncbi:hypothetical protein [Bradyrhizobium septentrionale]|uniref:Uncharacterized protein n=1 Tax=Bradyrhizobium septentrionale TaxID=1404411 RepID=A0ABZ2P4J7_9BRAD
MDQGRSDQEQAQIDSESLFKPTRRSVLIGAAALAVADPAKANDKPTRHFHLDFLDKTRRQVVVLTDVSLEDEFKPLDRTRDESQFVVTEPAEPKFLLSWDRREFGPNASFKIERVSDKYIRREPVKSEDGKLPPEPPKVEAWQALSWTLTVSRASFPGNEKFHDRKGSEFTAVFTFSRKTLWDNWAVSATMTRWWDAGSLVAGPIDLESFLAGRTLAFPVASGQNQLLKSLFGERIEAQVAFDLRVGHQLEWFIEAEKPAARPKEGQKEGRLYILDIPLEFGRLKLTRIRSDDPVASERRAAATAGEASPGDAKKNQKPAAAPEVGRPAATDRFLFETEVVHGRPPKVGKQYQPDGLYGALEDVTGFTQPNRKTPDPRDIAQNWTFNFAAVKIDKAETSVVFALDKAAISFESAQSGAKGKPRARVAAAIRHWGFPEHTVAGCIVEPVSDTQGIGRISVSHGSPNAEKTEGPFEFSGFELVRQLHAKAKAVVTRLSVEPVTKETAVNLQIGSVCIAGLPAVSAKPGVEPRVPPIVVQATEKIDAADKDRRILEKFSCRVALCSAALTLPDRIAPKDDKGPAQVILGRHVTRLDFHDADALIYLPALGLPPNSSADAVIPIGPASAAGKVLFDLGRAQLSVLRPSDLLALKFRFSGLELVAPWPPVTDKAAELAPRGGRSPGRPFARASDGQATPRDERPLLVVEFPPQHVVERAYFKQLPPDLDLPELTGSADDEEQKKKIDYLKSLLSEPKHWSSFKFQTSDERNWLAKLLERVYGPRDVIVGSTREERIKLRDELQKEAKWPDDLPLFPNAPQPGGGAPRKTAKDFDAKFRDRTKNLPPKNSGIATAPLPEEQQYYAGADFLDPDARRIALEVLRDLKREEEGPAPAGGREPLWPFVDDVDKGEWTDLFRFLVAAKTIESKDIPKQADWPNRKVVDTNINDSKSPYREVLLEAERARERRNRDYAVFRNLYSRLAREPESRMPSEQQQYFGRAWFKELPDTADLKAFKEKLLASWKPSDDEAVATVVPARLSGPSRIAFRVDCEDYESDRGGGRIPFTLEGLTNWGGMDMAVVRRAERLMEPLQGTRLPPRWGRRAMTDEGAILRYQGFTSSDRWGRGAEKRRRDPAKAAVGPAQRLAEVYASSAQAPDTFETAIELPFRLFLSPAQDATWTTSAPRVRRDAGFPDEDAEAFRELWTARLSGSDATAGVRAVWSPDYRPEALLSTAAPGAPPMGPYAPWALPRSYGLRNSPDREIEQFRTGLEAFDRHELVVLSSVHGLPVLGRRAPSGDLAPDADQIEPPDGFRLQGLLPEIYEKLETDMTAIYRPKALSVTELSLSALGGNLDMDAGFQPPAAARTLLDKRNLFDALSIERWRQRTVLGRDIVVEVVYKGFLFPLGHRASLVKLTERRFMAVEGRDSPMAVLVQRLFIKIGKPEKRYPAEGQANRGSRWPCERIVMLTRQTPDLVDARNDDGTPGAVPSVSPRGKIKLTGQTTGLCMWPRTSSREGAEVWFEMQVGDEAVPVRLPLIFIDNIAANDDKTVGTLIDYYKSVAAEQATSPTRRLLRNGQPVVMAPEYKPGDTTFETAWWRLTAEGRELNAPKLAKPTQTIDIDNKNYIRDSFMEGQDQPPFYPVVDSAMCRLKSVERFTGSGPLWAEVTFDGEYVARGFVDPGNSTEERDRQSEVFLRILRGDAEGDTLPLNFEERGDLGGGVARPTMDVVAISRRLGPINGGKKGTPPGQPEPDAPSSKSDALPVLDRIKHLNESIDIFPKGKFLGIMELSKLVEKVLGINLHPKLTDVIEYGASSALGAAAEQVAAAAGDVRSALTQALISPAADAVAEVQKAWRDLAAKRLKLDKNIPSLADIYPQVGTDIEALRKLLDAARQPAMADAAFFEGLSSIYEAARRLTRTIDAIARDPLAAAAGAQVELFRKLLKPIDEVRAAIDQFETLKDLPEKLPELIVDAAKEAAVAELRRRAAAADTPAAIAVVEAAVKASLPSKEDWNNPVDISLKLAEVPGKLADNLKSGAATLTAGSPARAAIELVAKNIEDAAKELEPAKKAAVQARQSFQQLQRLVEQKRIEIDDQQKAIAASLLVAVNRAEQRLIEQAVEILLSRSLAVALRVAADAAAIWRELPRPPLDQDKLVALLAALAPALDILAAIGKDAAAAKLISATAAVCKTVKSVLSAGVNAVLPKLDVLKTTLCFVEGTDGAGLVQAVLVQECTAAPAVKALHEAAYGARKKLDELTDKTPGNDFDKAAGSVFAEISRLHAALTAVTTEIGNIDETTCAAPQQKLISSIRGVVGQQRVLTSATEHLVRTTTDILNGPSLENIADTKVREAFDNLIGFLSIGLERLPDLALAGNLPNVGEVFEKFAAAITELANIVRPTLPKTAATLDQLAAEQKGRDVLRSRKQALDAARASLKTAADDFKTTGRLDTIGFRKTLDNASSQFILMQEAAVSCLERAFAADIYDMLASAVDVASAQLADLLKVISPRANLALIWLARFYETAIEQRGVLQQFVNPQTGTVARVLDTLTRDLNAGDTRADLFNVYAPSDSSKTEQLGRERDLAVQARTKWSTDQAAALAALGELSEAWRSPALGELVRRFSRLNGAFLRVVVVEALDLRALRRELDRIVRELVPTRATLSYDLATPVREFGLPGVGKVFLPVKGTRLDIKMRASINLLDPKAAPDARIDGHMGPFGIQLFGDFDVVLLNFRGLDFRAGGGRSSGFDVRFGDFVIGQKAKFLKQLEPFVSPKGSLPPVRPMKDKPGIEATYGVNLGSFGIGTLSFSNVSLNAGARLPFGATDEAEFIVSIGRSDAPFLISSTIFGGGGYLALLANGKGFIGLETSFDYGGVFTFGFGPLSGTGQITLGLYFRAARGEPARLGMNFMARGAANIACFSFSTSLFVRLTYVNGKMDGTATYTFSFSIGIDDIDFTFEVYVSQGSGAGGGSPTNSSFLDLPGMPGLTQFAGADPRILDAYASVGGDGPRLCIKAPSQKASWKNYRKLFDPALNAVVDI